MDNKDDNKGKTDWSQQYLANERTFLSWVRTSIALIGLGFVISKFSFFLMELKRLTINSSAATNESIIDSSDTFLETISNWIGMGTIILAVLLILFALKNYLSTDKSIKTQTYMPSHGSIFITTALIVILSLIVFLYLMSIPND